jgi:hypothetical protein
MTERNQYGNSKRTPQQEATEIFLQEETKVTEEFKAKEWLARSRMLSESPNCRIKPMAKPAFASISVIRGQEFCGPRSEIRIH